MFDKNHLMGNIHLKAEATGDFVQRIQKSSLSWQRLWLN